MVALAGIAALVVYVQIQITALALTLRLTLGTALGPLQSALLAALAFAGRLTIEWLALLAFAHGVIHALSVPANYGLLPRFVEQALTGGPLVVHGDGAQVRCFAHVRDAVRAVLAVGPSTATTTNLRNHKRNSRGNT